MGSFEATGKGLVDWLSFTSEKGMLNANTAGSLRAASREVLSAVEPDGWEAVDLRTIDIEDMSTRFERLRLGKYKPESLLVYKSRFRNAVQMYLQYIENPSGWKYKPERPAALRKKPAAPGVKGEAGSESSELPGDGRITRSGTIEYPFPLRPGMVVTLKLPVDLTKQESKRLSGFIDSLAVDSTLALPAHSGTGGGEVKLGVA
jgi:hypothetical protein